MQRSITAGDLGKYRGKICVVLQVDELFIKILKIKTRKMKKLHPNCKELQFPPNYFQDRIGNRRECARFLTYDVDFLNKNYKISSFLNF